MRNQNCFTTTLLAVVGLSAVGLLVAGCGGSGETTSSGTSRTEESTPATDAETTTTKAISAQVPTLPLDPTVFDPTRIGDLLELSSFVLTVDEFHSANGTPSTTKTITEYIKDPKRISVVADFGQYDLYKEYFVDGATLQKDHQNYWFIFANGSLAAPDLLQNVNRSDSLSSLISATFVGEEAFDGIPAYHYTFDETNTYGYTPENPTQDGEGEFFLAKDGNHLLYAHSRMVAAGEGFELIDEFTETLSSVNALAEIPLPDDIVPLKDALDLGTLLGIPMPADGVVDSMINYNAGGVGMWYYQYTSLWSTEAEFMDFYRTLLPTNGWTVTWLGQVKNLDVDCADGNCVIIKNGDKQVILYFDGSNLHADWDREHQYGPCTNPQSPTACG